MSDFTKAIEQFEKLASELFIQENKKYTAGLLAPRFKEAAARLRHDVTINQAAFVLERVAQRDPAKEITASDLKKLANEFYTSDTKFNIEFGDLLEEKKEEIQKETNRLDFEGGSGRNLEFDGAHESATTDLYNENADNSSLVDVNLSYAAEDLPLIQHAAQLIDEELKNTGRVSKVSSILKHRTDDKLFFHTTIRTASSEADTTVLVPVELSNNVPLFPQVMATTDQVYTLDTEGLDTLTSDNNASIEWKRANHINNLRSANEFDMALRDDTQGQEVVHEFDVETPKQISLGHEEIEKVLRDAVLTTDSRYSQESRDSGRQLVESELTDLGFTNSQVSFNGDYAAGLTYKASVNTELGKLEITIPVEENKNMLFSPSQFATTEGSSTYTLSKEAVSQAARDSQGTLKQDIHPFLFAMSYPDLKKKLKEAAHQKQHKTAQQIISLIDEKFGDHYRNSATDDYQVWLEESTQNYEERCGDCNYYVSKTSQVENDFCNLIKTSAKNVQKDEEAHICTRSTYAGADESVHFDAGSSIKINWED